MKMIEEEEWKNKVRIEFPDYYGHNPATYSCKKYYSNLISLKKNKLPLTIPNQMEVFDYYLNLINAGDLVKTQYNGNKCISEKVIDHYVCGGAHTDGGFHYIDIYGNLYGKSTGDPLAVTDCYDDGPNKSDYQIILTNVLYFLICREYKYILFTDHNLIISGYDFWDDVRISYDNISAVWSYNNDVYCLNNKGNYFKICDNIDEGSREIQVMEEVVPQFIKRFTEFSKIKGKGRKKRVVSYKLRKYITQ